VTIHDEQTTANTLRQQAETINILVNVIGFTNKRRVVEAVCDGDLRKLFGEDA
jgi:enoyl-[acyl-carrier-protein] reductase (NADH)